jgi:hypothetical protein
MNDANFRDGEPATAKSTSVTDADSLLRRPCPIEVDHLPEIALPARSRREKTAMCCLLAAAPAVLMACILFRDGRDLTVPFLFGEGIISLVAIGLIGIGVRRRDRVRAVVGGFSVILAFGLGMSATAVVALWSGGCREMPITAKVIDVRTGKPIADARVTISNPLNIAIAQTDQEGQQS